MTVKATPHGVWRGGSAAPAAPRWAQERGAELVEFAMVIPILLVIFAGIVDFSFMLRRAEVITNAAREGARIAILPGYQLADVQARVNQYLNEGIGPGSSANATTSMNEVSVTVAVGPALDARQVVVVYTSRYDILGPIMDFVGGSNFGVVTLTGRATMRLEVQGP